MATDVRPTAVYELLRDAEGIERELGAVARSSFLPMASVVPLQITPIVRAGFAPDLPNGAPPPREIVLAQWGLVPTWVRSPRFGERCIKARAETLERLPAYRSAYRRRRCLVPATAFFEPDRISGSPDFWRVTPAHGGILALAGMWERWFDSRQEQTLESFAIVTCRANSLIAPLHGRMPVIISPQDFDHWLDFRRDPRILLVPAAANTLRLDRNPEAHRGGELSTVGRVDGIWADSTTGPATLPGTEVSAVAV